jgi:alpha-mannosidase
MQKIHLVCNAHLDPVWLWEWEEGAAEALSTFRTAARFCEEFDGFIFNHNEALLYKWVETYDIELFKRIQKLVKQGKWHIMGGWYLQPDCNMPSGESLIRQILIGKGYFKEKFDVEPSTAINFDSFGHSQGLVQILKKSGFDSYIFQRPDKYEFEIDDVDFIWEGFDGSRIYVHHSEDGYMTHLGEAEGKILSIMERDKGKSNMLVLWGIGNHGGGPSHLDLCNIKRLMEQYTDREIIHSTPEKFFFDLSQSGEELRIIRSDLNPNSQGCYTSQCRIKQKHCRLENEFYMLEKMAANACINGLMKYPVQQLNEIIEDLLFSEFHDILPGSSIKPVEETALRLIDHGLENMARLRMQVFISLASGQQAANEGEIPIFIFNPHPYKIEGVFECEFQLADQNWKDEYTDVEVFFKGRKIPSQLEKEKSNLNLDWRKRIVFKASLEPSQMNRFDCRMKVLSCKPKFGIEKENDFINFKTKDLNVIINCNTGLIDKYEVQGIDFLKDGAFLPLVILDNENPWGHYMKKFDKILGKFELLGREKGSMFSGIRDKIIDSVRVIEDGAVRMVVEAVLGYGDSFIRQHYKLPKEGSEIQVQTQVFWNEKDKMLKLSVPTQLSKSEYWGQTACGIKKCSNDGSETVAQKWVCAVSPEDNLAVSCVNNGIYGSDCNDGEIRMSLLRSSAYSALPILQRPVLAEDRFTDRMEQGERLFELWINASDSITRRDLLNIESITHNEVPFALSFFPEGKGSLHGTTIELDNSGVQMSAFKKAEKSEDYIIRLFESRGVNTIVTLKLSLINIEEKISMNAFEIITFKLNLMDKTLTKVNLMESNEN